MAGSAATFGSVGGRLEDASYVLTYQGIRFFMAIGTTIRTDSDRQALEAFARARRRPIVMPQQARQYTNMAAER